MASTNFQDYNQNTPIVASWLNDVNGATYTAAGTKRVALQIAAAWVRFNVNAGVVTIQQSSNISTVVRTSTGVFVITYGKPMTNVANCYSITLAGSIGVAQVASETASSVTVNVENLSGTAIDPVNLCLTVFGAN